MLPLRCPASHQPLAPLTGEALQRYTCALSAGTLRSVDDRLPEPFEGALATPDGAHIYPIRSGIPVLLRSERLQLPPS